MLWPGLRVIQIQLFDLSLLNERETYISNARVTDIVGFTSSASSDSFRMDLTAHFKVRFRLGTCINRIPPT